ncbi:hypothetical protein L6164_021362 [Bauhinia variegata]|uniref:Uncharacterized protein n=1 Tax=Bauhinia variegata TaxID=167791 RepID=A0ACB9MZ99_BAUVA|nr:hypothetical protein L6164_021362 [Bauhinia variegata]
MLRCFCKEVCLSLVRAVNSGDLGQFGSKIFQGWRGPNYSISTVCATSNFSILSAANHILKDIMLSGGSDAAIIPHWYMLSFCDIRCA